MLDPDIADALIAESIAASADEEIVVGCLPANMIPAVSSATHICSACGRLIWVSARILGVLPARAQTVCLDCITGNGMAALN